MNPTARPAASQRPPFRQRCGTSLARLLARSGIGRLAADKSGVSAILIGLLSMVLLAFSALGTEVVYWYTVHRDLQNAADSAALSAVAALENIGGTPDSTHSKQATAEANYTSQRYGFTGGAGGVIVTVNIPPTSGAYMVQPAGKPPAVEVILSAPQKLALTSAISFNGNPLFAGQLTQKARAVATAAMNGNGCVVTLDAGTVGITQNGNGSMNLAGCDLYVNADSATALDQNGNATLTAANAYVVGGITDNGKAALTTSGGTYTGTAPVNDPYANLAAPTFSTSPLTANGCFNDSTPTILGATMNTVGSVTTVTPTSQGGTVVFCNENWPGSAANGTFQLAGGLYVFDGGSLGCQSCTVSGSDVTIYLTGGTGSSTNYAYMSFSGNGTAQLNISAPDVTWMGNNPGTQALLGIAIFGDRNDPCNTAQHTCSLTSTFSGNASATINGAIYIPDQNITWNGNGGNTPTCSQLISFQATMNGNGTFTTSFSDDPSQANNGCNPYRDQTTGLGMGGAGAIPAHLVE
ncbi:MAG TPA: pilus assembly protein TadG-related protein [Stellaceae bacterium]